MQDQIGWDQLSGGVSAPFDRGLNFPSCVVDTVHNTTTANDAQYVRILKSGRLSNIRGNATFNGQIPSSQ